MIPIDVVWDQEVQYEQCVDHLYKDDKGNPTSGCGNLTSLETMLSLPWLRRSDDGTATRAEIMAEWVSVARLPGNMSEAYYAKFTQLYLTVDSIKKLFGRRVSEFATALASMFPGFDVMPQNAQLALLDMIFNTGQGTLERGFPRFCSAVRSRDWETAAGHCHRHNRNPDVAGWDPTDKHERRQIMVRDLLLSCIGSDTS